MTDPSTPPAAASSFDARALTEPVDRARLTAWSRATAAAGGGPRVWPIVLVIVVCGMFAVVAVGIVSVFLSSAWGSASGVVTTLLLLFVVGLAVWGGLAWWTARSYADTGSRGSPPRTAWPTCRGWRRRSCRG